jgi:hypothetical protein
MLYTDEEEWQTNRVNAMVEEEVDGRLVDELIVSAEDSGEFPWCELSTSFRTSVRLTCYRNS